MASPIHQFGVSSISQSPGRPDPHQCPTGRFISPYHQLCTNTDGRLRGRTVAKRYPGAIGLHPHPAKEPSVKLGRPSDTIRRNLIQAITDQLSRTHSACLRRPCDSKSAGGPAESLLTAWRVARMVRKHSSAIHYSGAISFAFSWLFASFYSSSLSASVRFSGPA